jgi:hypothetical protein
MSAACLIPCLGLALAVAPAAAAAERPARAEEAPVWLVDGKGRRFRVRFDPGHRFYAGAGAAGLWVGGRPAPGPVLELGLALRAAPPPFDAEVFWKRDHELGRLRLGPGSGGAWLEARLYRGTFLRHSREGSFTIPTTPPLRVTLPFDVGVRIELGRLAGTWPLSAGSGGLDAGVVRGDALADFLRSERPGRWLALGVTGYYDVRLAPVGTGPWLREHRVGPLTAAVVSARGEDRRGLLAGGLRVEWGRAWSSLRGWGQELRIDAHLEVTPVAVNDLPLSLVLEGGAESGVQAPPASANLRLFAGVRLGAPLR